MAGDPMMNDSRCPFCERIAAGEYDEEPRRGCYIFAPLNPVTPGHLLVVPGEHVRDAAVAPATTAAVMFEAALKVQRLAGAANIITSVGRYATQSVYHLHVHVVPRREGDGLALPWTGTAPSPLVAATDVLLPADTVAAERERWRKVITENTVTLSRSSCIDGEMGGWEHRAYVPADAFTDLLAEDAPDG
jgi:histidine triad (HIT) family protein